MNYDVSKQLISASDLIYKGTHEIPLDADFTLPDYCPDIGRILKCRVNPNVISRNISGDRLNAEGSANIVLLYTDLEKNTVRCYKTEMPFSHSFDLKNSPEQAAAIFDIKIEYINCRAVSPRRIDIHGAFSLKALVHGKKNTDVTTEISGSDIEKQKVNTLVSELTALAQQQFTISEVLSLGSEKPAIEFIVRSEAKFYGLESSCADSKVNIKGFITIKILYMSDIETGKLENTEYDIPVNQVIDAPGVNDESNCLITPEIIFHEEKISSDSEDNNSLINAEIKLMFTVLAFEDKETEVISDVYSTEYEADIVKNEVNLTRLSNIVNELVSQKSLIESENKILKVIDIWSDYLNVSYSSKNSESAFVGKAGICILALDTDSSPFYLEREVEFKKELQEQISVIPSKIQFSTEISSIGYKLTGDNTLNLKIEIKITANFFENFKIFVVTEVTADETKLKPKDTAALTVYYASSGENLWDIAKRYGTTVDKIKDENDIDFETISGDRAILIPMN
ncbi:MAG: DUF3794 domain-containing protein [Oscillospiraceae bacterium]|jgi:LysM repeat protein|nr:DUF3794 domain-containing protein [Oscillospiraceae bacterium]